MVIIRSYSPAEMVHVNPAIFATLQPQFTKNVYKIFKVIDLDW